MKYNYQKRLGKERVCLLKVPHHGPLLKEVRVGSQGSQGVSLREGTDAEAMEDHCVLASSL